MRFTSPAIMLALHGHGEHGAVIRLLTPEHGLQAAYVRGRPDGRSWTARTLAEAAGCGRSSAASFLQRQHSPAGEHGQ